MSRANLVCISGNPPPHSRAAELRAFLGQGARHWMLRLPATKAGRWHAQGPDVQMVSTLGSRDSFLGGLALALDGGRDGAGALRDAVAAGTANTLSAGEGDLCSRSSRRSVGRYKCMPGNR